MNITSPIIIALIAMLSSIITTVISQLVIRNNFKSSVKENYRKEYFERQLNAYQKFWTQLRPLSNINDNKAIWKVVNESKKGKTWILKTKIAIEFCEASTDFYFSEYGLYLGYKSRQTFFRLRNKLYHFAKIYKDDEVELDHKDRKAINGLKGQLMNEIREELGVLNLKFDIKKLGIKKAPK